MHRSTLKDLHEVAISDWRHGEFVISQALLRRATSPTKTNSQSSLYWRSKESNEAIGEALPGLFDLNNEGRQRRLSQYVLPAKTSLTVYGDQVEVKLEVKVEVKLEVNKDMLASTEPCNNTFNDTTSICQTTQISGGGGDEARGQGGGEVGGEGGVEDGHGARGEGGGGDGGGGENYKYIHIIKHHLPISAIWEREKEKHHTNREFQER
ncbi:hypothetical protein ACE6H2_026901 [Prunus campanulata]